MTRVLLTAYATVGHTNAPRAIGRTLIADGSSVAMAMQAGGVPVARGTAMTRLLDGPAFTARAAALVSCLARVDGARRAAAGIVRVAS